MVNNNLDTNHATIDALKSELEAVILRLGNLEQELHRIKEKYDQNVGGLKIDIDILESQIATYSRLIAAVNRKDVANIYETEEKIFSEQQNKEKEFEQHRERTKLSLEKFNSLSEDEQDELRKLKRELSKKYHPDLGGDQSVMILINNAYRNTDLIQLRDISQGLIPDNISISNSSIGLDVDTLRSKIREREEDILSLQGTYWYKVFKEISNNNTENIFFANLSKDINVELKNKRSILAELKKTYEENKTN